jgi:hypothetical protein
MFEALVIILTVVLEPQNAVAKSPEISDKTAYLLSFMKNASSFFPSCILWLFRFRQEDRYEALQ